MKREDTVITTSYHPVKPQIRLRFCGDKPFFGPGVYDLLTLVGKTGSLQDACHNMNMSYSKGSRMVKEAERQLGFPLTQRWAGGSGGGGSRLTEEGEGLLENYQKMVSEIQEYTDILYNKYFKEES